MTTLQNLQQTLHRFVETLRRRRQLRRELVQLEAMGSLDAVLADAGLMRSQIAPLIAGCAGSRELLDQMVTRLGVDTRQLPVETVRDMTWACTTCADKRKCRDWLAGTEEKEYRTFCPNAAQLDHALSKQRPSLQA
jgi:uncharacterized protein YjiS (DUF1127 family)